MEEQEEQLGHIEQSEQTEQTGQLIDQIAEESKSMNELAGAMYAAKQEIGKLLIGMDETIDMVFATLLCKGHLLLEGVPGIAKTLLSKLVAKSLDADFSRIQFTPDLMPSDVVGTNIFNVKNASFEFKKGPIFSNIVLIDEINRAPAKTQAALFEVMEEGQITVDTSTYTLAPPFFVMATQNPIEQEGTYKLPEAQLDRFLVKLIAKYPSYEEELAILERFQNDFSQHQIKGVQAVLTKEKIAHLQELVEKVHIDRELLVYIAKIISLTRDSADLFLGASPRASLALLKMSKAMAAMRGRTFVTPDDVKYVAKPVLNHRIILTAEKEIEGGNIFEVIDELINSVEVPR